MTAPLKLTPARLAVLRAVADGRVSGHRTHAGGWRAIQADSTAGSMNHAVTAIAKALLAAGLVQLGAAESPSWFAIQRYLLTDEGHHALLENPEA